MKIHKVLATLATALVVLIVGCKKDDFVEKVGLCPIVIATVPTTDSSGIPIDQIVTVTFNEKMNPATITQTSFTLQEATKISGSKIAGALVYDGTTPTFSFAPTSLLSPNTTYNGTVSQSVKDMMGNALQEDYVWSFTTAPTEYTVNLSSNPLSGGTTSGEGSYVTGTSVSLGAIANEGYTFTNWTEGTTVVSSNALYTFTITGNRVLVANFEATINTVTLNLSALPSGSGTTTGAGSYVSGTSVTIEATANDGYSFANWSEGSTILSTNSVFTFTLTENRTLVANFVETGNTFSVSLSSNPVAGGTTIGEGSYLPGASVTIHASANDGYDFVNWTENGTIVFLDESFTFTIMGNRTLVANFEETISTFTLSLSSNPEAGGTTSGGGSFKLGTSVTIEAGPNDGYTFINWTEGTTILSTQATYTFAITENRIMVANFEETVNTFRVNLSSIPAAGGTTIGDGSYVSGASVTISASANDGYSFINWTEDGNIITSDESYTFNIIQNRTLVANFNYTGTGIILQLSEWPLGTGTTEGAGEYQSGETAIIQATANDGYIFISWTEDDQVISKSAYYLFTIYQSRTLVALFADIGNTKRVSITSNPAEGGTTIGEGVYITGSSVTIHASVNEGYRFINWTEGGNIVSTNESYDFIITQDQNLVANFEASGTTYTVNLTSNPAAGGTTTGDGTYNSGAAVTIEANPNTGYTFTNWTEGANILSTEASLTFNITGNRTLVANFEEDVNTYTVTLTSNPAAGGTTTGDGTYNSGAAVTIEANPNTGYTFTNWTEGANILSTEASLTFNITGNRTLIANFSGTPKGPGVVNLGTAGNYVVLTKTGISTTGTTSITGNIGVSPASSTAITGFNLTLDATNQFATSPYVVGKVYAADYAAPTPANITTAISDLETAYTAGNGFVTAPINELYAGNLNGQTLAPGLYKWSTGVDITTGITLDGGPEDTWIFQVAQDFTIANGAIITLTGGAQVKNIAWIVAGQSIIGTDVDFSGVILSQTLISLNSGAKVTGRLLAQTAVTLIASTIVQSN